MEICVICVTTVTGKRKLMQTDEKRCKTMQNSMTHTVTQDIKA